MRLFALIGFPLTHSFSEKYFTEKFIREGITDASFKAFSIEQIDDLKTILANNPDLEGFAITIPHKKAILDFLNDSTTTVKVMGACNCVRIKNSKLFGHNTDVLGFERSFAPLLQPHHTKALVLGTGGASAAVIYVLNKLDITYRIVSRDQNTELNYLVYEDLDALVMKDYNIIINTTPLGTFPKIDETPNLPYQLVTPQHYLFDLVYNPAETKFLSYGKAQGATVKNGYDMLVLQAEENWRIWNDLV
ncbi:MAG: shikimate dehydrogenase [Deinococcales bacterium]|nr:shikimate dehydrogenase [Chitinophagaceae bacterium]